MNEQVWKHIFVVHFAKRMNDAGYDADDLLAISYQHANASWGVNQGCDSEECSDAEYDALCDSV